ncbi:response regulator transcription factor [Lacibacter sp. H375]|uniref:response regulator transcription factor n=1 Tax=Lacibacter sp. H375 TaxID=3133424 RepID=UPI0030BB9674
MMNLGIKVFIVDDHYMVIEGIRSLLQHEKGLEWMGHAMNAESCIAFLNGRQPDVIFMDINLPDKSGIDLCKEVNEKYPSISIIGLSTYNQQSFITKMIENGASGYVLKNATKEELLFAIQTVVRGRIFLSHEAAMITEKKEGDDAPVLTRREKQILELIADGLTTQEIANKLFISGTTVETHRKNLLLKLEAKNVAAMVKIAAKLNLI